MSHDHSLHTGTVHTMPGPGLGSQLAGGTLLLAATPAARGAVGRLLTHPLVMFALGATAGYFAYKYRKEIADAALRASEMGKDFVLNQKETLEDLMEEAKDRAGPPA
jgi:hypothetical protein